MSPQTAGKLALPFFIVVSLACTQGTRWGLPWVGLALFLALAPFFLWHAPQIKERVILSLLVAAAGFVLETALIFFGVYTVAGHARWLVPAPFCPEWILGLWINFGFMLYVYWRLLSRSQWLAASIGAVFSVLIFGNAAFIGLLSLRSPHGTGFAIIAACWALLIPLMAHWAVRFFGGIHDAAAKK
jgi:hypothetical protein